MKPQGPLTAGVVILLWLVLAWPACAQLPWRLFGGRAPEKAPPVKSVAPDLRRLVEVNVEVAWLADPVTFPYYLEAHINSAQQLEVRGYVPNKMVREHALRIAQVFSSLPVFDSMKEHTSLLVRPSQLSPQQLQNSVQSSLRVALPKQYQQLRVDCAGDGKVYVSGPVSNYEEKIAVSHTLRRLHGCTSVQNMTSVPADVALGTGASPRGNALAGQDRPAFTNAADTRPRSWIPWPIAKSTPKQEPADTSKKPATALVDASSNQANPTSGPILIPPTLALKPKSADLGTKGTPDVIKVELPAPAAKGDLSAMELQKRIRSACPNVTEVEVTFTAARQVRIVISARLAADIGPIAERIYMLQELQNYRAVLQFKIAAP